MGTAASPFLNPIAAELESVSPLARDPVEIDHVYGGCPPLAARLCEYAVPISPPGNDAVVTTGAATTLIESALVADPETLSVTLTVKFAVPATDGVPLIWPAELSVKPVGSVPAEIDHVYGGAPPLAARVCE